MASGNENLSDSFREYAGLLVRLHDLIVAGKDESPEADELRDAMDAPWYGMNNAERTAIDGLSADLYSIGESSANGERNGIDETIIQLLDKHDWLGVLEFVRRDQLHMSPPLAAHFRGLCWSGLDCPDVALRFFVEAHRLAPQDPEREKCLLVAYAAAKSTSAAVQMARSIAATSHDIDSLILAAIVLFAAAENDPAHSELERVAMSTADDVRKKTLNWPGLPGRERLRKMLTRYILALEGTGKSDQALAVCEDAIQRFPSDRDLLVLHAWLLRDRSREQAWSEMRAGVGRDIEVDLIDVGGVSLGSLTTGSAISAN